MWVAILAGGIGSRFWPLSTRDRPKQLLPLTGARPLIVETVERALEIAPPERVKVLAGAPLAEAFRPVLGALPEEAYWIEPRARGTAPVLAWAAWKLARIDPEAVMVSLHADHSIRPLAAFRSAVETAVAVARREGLLVSLGVRPDRVETGYGHIELGGALEGMGPRPAHRVRAFHEKPDHETARRYTEAGCLWNTGIFVWKAATLLEELARHAPEVAVHLPLLERGDEPFFEAVQADVIDRAVMERSGRVATVEADFEWDDIGSWESLARCRPTDDADNVLVGAVRAVDSSGNIVFAEDGEIVMFDVEDLVVVRSGVRTLVTTRSGARDLKKLLSHLEEDGP